MNPGRKPKHAFNHLKLGEKALLQGSAAIYPHQFIFQYNKNNDKVLKVVHSNGKTFAERTK